MMISNPLPEVGVDRMQIGQVLQNIVINAVQAMPGGGALRIAARLVGAPPCGRPETGGHGGPPLQDFLEISVEEERGGEGCDVQGNFACRGRRDVACYVSNNQNGG